MKADILVCGVGGQGTVLASKLIASASMSMGSTVHSAETIGMAQRGGSVTSHIRIGNDAYSPLIPFGSADMIIAFEPAEAVRNLMYLKKDGFVVVNRIPVKPAAESLHDSGYDGSEMIGYIKKKCGCLVVDASELCGELGAKFYNSAILGAAAGTGKLGISPEALISEIRQRVPERFVEANIKVFTAGLNANAD